jgi:hypothetical protein
LLSVYVGAWAEAVGVIFDVLSTVSRRCKTRATEFQPRLVKPGHETEQIPNRYTEMFDLGVTASNSLDNILLTKISETYREVTTHLYVGLQESWLSNHTFLLNIYILRTETFQHTPKENCLTLKSIFCD